MSDEGQVIAQMVEHGMPPLPGGVLQVDGKFHKFGKGKKAWYKVTRVPLRTGREILVGAFGIYQGLEPNSVKINIDYAPMTEAERADFDKKQRAAAQAVADEDKRIAQLAANRGREEFKASAGIPVEHPYLVRKQVAAEGVRVNTKGELIIPLVRGGQIIGLQKIDQAGEKRFNKGIDKNGSMHFLGQADGAEIIAIGEGYATCKMGRDSLAPDYDLPAAMGIDAGNLIHVAQQLRAQHPQAHLLFLVDDDYLLAERFAKCLVDEFKVSVPVLVDGQSHQVLDEDGGIVTVTAWWRKDAQGIDYIEADIRAGRRIVSRKFENAGLASCTKAAKTVGNASLAIPLFADRGGRKLTDFNDLGVEEGIETVRTQLVRSILAAQQRNTAFPVLPPATAGTTDLPDSGPAGEDVGSPCPLDDACEAAEARPSQSAADALAAVSPHPSEANAAPDGESPTTLEWALAHCALVHGTTDVWDGVNKLRMKRAAFVEMIGSDIAKAWSADGKRRLVSPRNLPKLVRGVAVQDGGAGEDNIVMMLDRYTLLYGTKTVYDAYKKSIIGYDAMALARGSDLASRWLSHPLHLEKDYDKVVFDPTQRVDLNTHINLFEGFPLKPRMDEEKALLVLDLLHSLCATEANSGEVFQWVLRWLAYPLQHPGAKMQTALLFFGEKQGTGKSLFFEGIIKPIYGSHGATGGQHQLEGNYSHWRSQKLFVLYEEVLSRQDKYSYFGLIKHMITGRDTTISQKFKDDRVEANHMNTVVLSNEFQALPLEPEDRRFLVVDVRQMLDAQLLANISRLLDHGIVEAFYAFLLSYPLGDFTPHTKPVMTESKERVINFGRPDWETFYLAWSREELSAPWCSCLTTDLYVVFSRYSSKYGLRAMSMVKFCELIGQRLKKDRQWVSQTPTARKKLLTVFHVPYEVAHDGKPERGSLKKLADQILEFRDLADIKGEL